MNKVSKSIAAGFIAFASLTSVTQSASALNPNFSGAVVVQINGQGFRACKAMGNKGYTAVARGLLSDGGGGGSRGSGFRPFQIRTCFTTSAACERFIDRIHHKIGQIEKLRYAGCKSRAQGTKIMKKLFLTLAVGFVAASPILSAASTSQAAVPGRGSIVKLNGEGFRKCKAFDASGTKAWTAKIKGRLDDDDTNPFSHFNIKSCFKTQAKCQNFIDRIHHQVLLIEEIRYTNCKVRNG